MIYDIGIIGAGASGMMAAVAAYREGLRICLFEHNDKPGKKILVTGNGKCNITNLNMTPECYNSNSDGSYFSVIKNFGPSELIFFFKKSDYIQGTKTDIYILSPSRRFQFLML